MELATPTLPNSQKTLSPEDKQLVQKALTDRVFLARKNLGFFCVDTLGLYWNWHHNEWKKIANRDKRVLVECARDHGKSHFWAFAYPLWRIKYAEKPLDICIVSYSQDQVMDLTSKIKGEVEKNEVLKGMLPEDYRDTWTKTEMRFNGGSTLKAKSFGSAMRGGHYDIIIVDDPIRDRLDMLEEDQLDFFYAILFPCLKPEGQLIVDGTPVRFGDLLEHIEKNSEFKTYKFPAIVGDNPLWARRYSKSALEERRKVIGSWRFSREYLLERISPETAPLKRDWLKYGKVNPEEPLHYFIAIDPNISKEETADYTGIVVVAVNPSNNMFVAETIKKRFNPLELINEIYRLNDKWHPLCIGLEVVAFQKVLAYWLREESNKRGIILPIKEIKSQRAKNERIMGLQPRMEAGKLFILPTMTELLEEIDKFRLEVDGSDDLLDALAMTNEMVYCPAPIIEDKLKGKSELEIIAARDLERLYNEKIVKDDPLY